MSRGKSSKKSSHGGSRAHAGRPTLESKAIRQEMARAAEQQIYDALPRLIRNMIRLADGGFEKHEDEFSVDESGEMVLTRRKVTISDPDKYANQYLIDRVMGRTKQAIEIKTDDDGQPRRIVIPDTDDRPEPQSSG